jgi:hypothetical protein
LRVGDAAKLSGNCEPSIGFVPASIKLQPIESVEIAQVRGNIEGIDPQTGTLQVMGFTVATTDQTTINQFDTAGSKSEPAGEDGGGASPAASRTRKAPEWRGLADVVRLPIPNGPALRARSTSAANPAESGGDPIQQLIDGVNDAVLDALEGSAPNPSYRLVFVTGSPVRNRLHVAHFCWRRLTGMVDLDEILRRLERTYERWAIDRVVGRVRRSVESELLGTGSKLGPAKLLFRLGTLPLESLAPEGYPEVERLVDEVARLSADSDQHVAALLRGVDLGKSRVDVSVRFGMFLQSFGGCELLGDPSAAFELLVSLFGETGTMHPALPISDELVQRASSRLGVSPEIARRSVVLFRMAWLTAQDHADEMSDFPIKAFLVVPGPADAANHDRLDALVEDVYERVRRAAETHPDLRAFRLRHAGVRIEPVAFVVSLPQPLFELFTALDSDDARLDLLCRYRLGAEYVERHVDRLRRRSEGTPFSWLVAANSLNGSLRALLDGVVFLTAKEGKSRVRRGRLVPNGEGPERIHQLLEQAIVEPCGNHAVECAWLLNEMAKVDLVGTIRGVSAMST